MPLHLWWSLHKLETCGTICDGNHLLLHMMLVMGLVNTPYMGTSPFLYHNTLCYVSWNRRTCNWRTTWSSLPMNHEWIIMYSPVLCLLMCPVLTMQEAGTRVSHGRDEIQLLLKYYKLKFVRTVECLIYFMKDRNIPGMTNLSPLKKHIMFTLATPPCPSMKSLQSIMGNWKYEI